MYARSLRWLAVLFFALITLGGCATQQIETMQQNASSSDYIIGPGDELRIMVWRNSEISSSTLPIPVRPDGKISTPLAEDVQASGKTPSQLAREVEKALGKFIQDPVVTIVVVGFVGPYNEQIRVIGQAGKPSALPYRQNMSLVDVMIEVGGLTDFASGNRASIFRMVDGKQQKFSVRLNDLIRKGDLSANVPMRPGDVLVIPESVF
jgi:polysaccharide export outer membrane protein